MASLPKSRLRVAVGVDYFGPIIVNHVRKQEKRYECLFTCLVTRAVQLEVAKSLETDLFINVPRRFIARRGPPSDVFYDNDANFVDRELKQSHSKVTEEWNPSHISDYLFQRDIKWHFNPPASYHLWFGSDYPNHFLISRANLVLPCVRSRSRD